MAFTNIKIAIVLAASLAHADVAVPGARAADAGDCTPKGKTVQTLDVNHDGKTDVWKLYAGDVLVCKQVDLNFDGKIDMQMHFARDGQPRLEEMDLDFDGRIDLWRVYDKGKRACDAMDLDGDGKADLWKRYVDDKPVDERTPTGACLALGR